MINHYIVRLDVSMHDTHRMTIVKPFQNFINIKAAVEISELLIQLPMIQAVDSFENES